MRNRLIYFLYLTKLRESFYLFSQILSKTIIGFYPNGAVGIEALESIINAEKPNLVEGIEDKLNSYKNDIIKDIYSWENLINDFEKDKNGLIITMEKVVLEKQRLLQILHYL